MTDVVSLKYYRAVASAAGATGNLSWYSVLNIYHKVTIAIKCRLIDDSLYQNFVDIEVRLLELFENVTGVRFF